MADPALDSSRKPPSKGPEAEQSQVIVSVATIFVAVVVLVVAIVVAIVGIVAIVAIVALGPDWIGAWRGH